MKKRKIFALLMSLTLILACMPMTVFGVGHIEYPKATGTFKTVDGSPLEYRFTEEDDVVYENDWIPGNYVTVDLGDGTSRVYKLNDDGWYDKDGNELSIDFGYPSGNTTTITAYQAGTGGYEYVFYITINVPARTAKSMSLNPSSVTLFSEDTVAFGEDGKPYYALIAAQSPRIGDTSWSSEFPEGATITLNYSDGTSRVYTNTFLKEKTDDVEAYTSYFISGDKRLSVYCTPEKLNLGANSVTVTASDYKISTIYNVTIETPEDRAKRAEAARQGVKNSKLPKVTISKPAKAKKAITVKWKKLSKKKQKKIDRIEIWVCNNKKFAAANTIMKQAKKSKKSFKIKGLKKKKNYYVKVRSIKYVNGVKTVGKWSKVKKVKTK